MFVQSKAETTHEHKNGVAIHQRRNGKETLVQWENGNQRWVETEDLQGTVRLIGSESVHEEY
tara:strand:- start:1973 stop:2158 length:186 start_codon:yes stop_codon:yes gene_type:complete